MKKLLAMLLALAMMLGCVAFGEGVDYTGTWVLAAVETQGMKIEADMLSLYAGILGLDMNMTMTLNADGTMTMSMMGMTEAGTWAATENGVAITDDEETLELPYQDGMLRMEQAGTAMMLAREGAAAQADAAVQADPNAAGYNYVGTWVLSGVEVFGIAMAPSAVGVAGDMALYEDGTCTLTMMDESQEGTWAATETGITTTDAQGVVDTYQLVNGELVAEQDGMKLIFTLYAPLRGLTVADFNGVWSLDYAEVYDYTAMTQNFYEAEELGMTMELTLADGKGHMVMTSGGETEERDAECVVEEMEDYCSMMYFMLLDETGAQDGSGLMLMMYPGAELTWYEYDSAADVEYYYNFVPKAE